MKKKTKWHYKCW